MSLGYQPVTQSPTERQSVTPDSERVDLLDHPAMVVPIVNDAMQSCMWPVLPTSVADKRVSLPSDGELPSQ